MHKLPTTNYQLPTAPGFSLVELLVSISIFLLFVTAIVDTTVGVNRQIAHASNIERATILAGEAVEVARNLRDNNFTNLVDGTYGLSTSTGQWSFLGSSDTQSIFDRYLTISTVDTNQKKVDVAVSWADNISASNNVSVSTYLTHWQKITPASGLTVTKDVINHGGIKISSDFAPYKVGTTTITLASSTTFLPNTYLVTETTSSNYTQTFTGDCDSYGSITLASGDAKICSITNEEKPSKLIVNKTVINHGQSKAVSNFTLYVDAVPVTSGDLNTFNSGSHTVSEDINSDFNSTIGGDCNSSGVVALVPNQTKTCSITNEEKLAYLTVNKIVTNHGGSKTSADFAPYKVGVTTVSLATPTAFDSGTYTISEATSSTHLQTFSGDCNSSGIVTLASGNSKTCTITNEEITAIPTVTLPTAVFISTTSATLGATVTFLGIPSSISARGTCWGTSPSPVTNCTVEGGTATGTFTQIRTGFTASTTYYYRGYATNVTGTGYSADGTFTTLPANCTGTPWGTMTSGTSNTAYISSAPTGACTSELRTCTNGTLSGSYTAISCTAGCTGTLWGNVISGYSNTAYLSSSVTYPSSCTSETRTCTAGTFSGSYTNLSCSVTNVIPTVTTNDPATSITQTTATDGGNVTSTGGASVTARGVVWDTSINPTIALSTKTSNGTGTGSFTSSLTSLTCNTTYHVRAYATNSVGTGYGSDVTFTTSACNIAPTVSTPVSSSITSITATLGATVTSLGIPATLTARGICYNTAGSPTLTNGATCVTATLAQTLTSYTVNVTGLIPATTYKFAGYVTNTTGTGYSADGTFTTLGNAGGVCTLGIFTPTTADNSGATSISVTKPTGIAQNDLLFAYIGHSNSTDRLNAPSGWTEIGRNHNGSANEALFYKVAGASEPANYSFTLSASSRFGASINAYRGCFSTSSPIATTTNIQYVVNNAIYRAASLNLTSPYSTVIVFPSVVVSGAKTFSAPAVGWNTEYNQGNSSSQFSRSAFSKTMTASGATGDIDSVGTFSGTTQKHSFGVVLNPL